MALGHRLAPTNCTNRTNPPYPLLCTHSPFISTPLYQTTYMHTSLYLTTPTTPPSAVLFLSRFCSALCFFFRLCFALFCFFSSCFHSCSIPHIVIYYRNITLDQMTRTGPTALQTHKHTRAHVHVYSISRAGSWDCGTGWGGTETGTGTGQVIKLGGGNRKGMGQDGTGWEKGWGGLRCDESNE